MAEAKSSPVVFLSHIPATFETIQRAYANAPSDYWMLGEANIEIGFYPADKTWLEERASISGRPFNSLVGTAIGVAALIFLLERTFTDLRMVNPEEGFKGEQIFIPTEDSMSQPMDELQLAEVLLTSEAHRYVAWSTGQKSQLRCYGKTKSGAYATRYVDAGLAVNLGVGAFQTVEQNPFLTLVLYDQYRCRMLPVSEVVDGLDFL